MHGDMQIRLPLYHQMRISGSNGKNTLRFAEDPDCSIDTIPAAALLTKSAARRCCWYPARRTETNRDAAAAVESSDTRSDVKSRNSPETDCVGSSSREGRREMDGGREDSDRVAPKRPSSRLAMLQHPIDDVQNVRISDSPDRHPHSLLSRLKRAATSSKARSPDAIA